MCYNVKGSYVTLFLHVYYKGLDNGPLLQNQWEKIITPSCCRNSSRGFVIIEVILNTNGWEILLHIQSLVLGNHSYMIHFKEGVAEWMDSVYHILHVMSCNVPKQYNSTLMWAHLRNCLNGNVLAHSLHLCQANSVSQFTASWLTSIGQES